MAADREAEDDVVGVGATEATSVVMAVCVSERAVIDDYLSGMVDPEKARKG